MHLYVLGGSGRTGRLAIDEAISRGHTVTTLSRDPGKVAERAGLTVLKGTPYVKADIESSFANPSVPGAVLVTLSAMSSDNPFGKCTAPHDTLEKSNRNVVEAMRAHDVKKIIVMQAQGVGNSLPQMNILIRLMIKYSSMGTQFSDHNNTLKMLQEQGKEGALQWVTPRPYMLKGEAKLPVKDMGDKGKGVSLMSSCSRGSVAKFMVDAVESDQWDGRTPVIIN